MKLNIRIGELLLHGLPITDADLPLVHESLVQCLTRRFETNSIDAAATPNLTSELRIDRRVSPAELGRELAQSLYPLAEFRTK